jgi:hypothetical protein
LKPIYKFAAREVEPDKIIEAPSRDKRSPRRKLIDD